MFEVNINTITFPTFLSLSPIVPQIGRDGYFVFLNNVISHVPQGEGGNEEEKMIMNNDN